MITATQKAVLYLPAESPLGQGRHRSAPKYATAIFSLRETRSRLRKRLKVLEMERKKKV